MTDYRRWHFALIALGLTLAASMSGLFDQLTNPFLHHDDIDYLLPPGTPYVADMWNKMLAEGRWGYFAWYQVSQHLRLDQVYLPYFVGMIVTAACFASLVARWVAPLVAFAFVLSVPLVEMSFWAVACTPGMFIATVAILAITRGFYPRLTILLCTPLLVLCYPPFSQFVLAVYIFRHRHRPLSEIAVAIAAYLIGYALGVLAISAINLGVFGHFGIIIADWRNPNPMRDTEGLVVNLLRAKDHLLDVLDRFAVLAVLTAAGLAIALWRPSTRRPAVYLLLLSAMFVGIEVGLTGLTGVVSASASFFWLWPVAIAPWAMLAETSSRLLMAVAAAALIAICGISYNMSADMLLRGQRVLAFEDYMVRTAQSMSSRVDPMIILYGDYKAIPDLRFIAEPDQIHNFIKARYGIDVVDCYPADCEAIAARLAAGETAPFMLNGAVVFAFSR